jgi:VanZ family protein
MNPTVTSSWSLRIFCLLTLSGILAAGLWPFRRPPNEVAWDGTRNGIRFGGHGVMFSSGPREPAESGETDSSALEIWLQPGRTRQGGTILAFYSQTAPTEFSLFQEDSSLGFRLHNQKNPRGPHFYDRLGGVFRSAEPVFITITSNSKMTTVYVDGVLAKTMPDFPLVLRNFEGQLVAGTAPAANLGWAGQLLGIATYAGVLTPAEATRHYEAWTRNGRPESLASLRNVALYLFDEHQGRLVHNVLGTGADLSIPERYTIIHQPLLALSRPHLSDWLDATLNVVAFVPLGFFLCACLSPLRPAILPAFLAFLLGTVASLGIEVLQAYLPDRTSDLTDLVTNAIGTAIGILLYRTSSGRTLLAKVALVESGIRRVRSGRS